MNLAHCDLSDRDRVFVVVYRDEGGLSHLKRFTFGGTILNREYSCVPAGAEIVLLAAGDPKTLYVKYKQLKGQQSFDLTKVAVRGVKTRGRLMTSKPIDVIRTTKPRGWSEKRARRSNSLLDL